ncbi:MAG: hypothetical protein AAFR87_10025 [Bacteroidota bacterium]
MKLSVPTFAAAIVVTAILSFFVGRSFPAKEISSNNKKAADKEVSTSQASASDLIATTSDGDGGAKTDSTKAEGEKIKPMEVMEADELSSNPIPSEGVVLNRINTGISDRKIGEILSSIADNMEKKRLAYISSKSQDCSGIFHQLKDSLQKRLPALAGGSSYQYPEYNNIRSSRQIADWYHKNGNLLIVEDPVASRNSIRPGSVMFYGKPNKKFKDMTIESLTDKNNNYTNNGAIMHIAVVTHVKTDEKGNVLEYTIMHGRNKRIHASRSGSKEVQSKRTKGLPPFGNWSQQWVAVANIMTTK